MSLGQTYNNNKNQYQPTVYSNYRMRNVKSSVDKTVLSSSFWNSSLKLSIIPLKQSGNDEFTQDTENAISIYMTHTKARIFANELKLFLQDPMKYNSSGVPSGQGLITISNGSEFNINSPCLVIRKINQDGLTESSYVYQFKDDYYFAVRNYKQKDSSFEKSFEEYKNIEIEQLLTLLETYYEAMTSAMAYSVIDNMKYDVSRINTKLELIANKLGVQFGKNNNQQQRSESFFNKSSSSTPSFNKTTLEDISSKFED